MTDTLTNESLAGICKNSFKLVEYAINLAKYYIASGRECNLKDILHVVKRHPNPHYIEELKEIDQIGKRSKERDDLIHE